MTAKWKNCLILVSLCLRLAGAADAQANDPGAPRLSDPVVFRNLAIYFVHGQSRTGPVPLTLQEALAKQVITVRETGQVNQLQVENTGGEEIFIQSGDIVKGGQQDRVLSVSLLLPPHSGAIRIESFCVESGRWSARSGEDSSTFSSADATLPSRVAKLAMAEAVAPQPAERGGSSHQQGIGKSHQQEIWNSVAQIQGKLTRNLGAPVAAPRSQTSLQLSLENKHLADEQAAFIAALQAKGEQSDDVVGYVFAVNGKFNSADIYPSNALFRKMWPKLLRASVTEAIGERDAPAAPAPSVDTVDAFIADIEKAKVIEAQTKDQARIGVKENAKALSVETRSGNGPDRAWVHRSLISK